MKSFAEILSEKINTQGTRTTSSKTEKGSTTESWKPNPAPPWIFNSDLLSLRFTFQPHQNPYRQARQQQEPPPKPHRPTKKTLPHAMNSAQRQAFQEIQSLCLQALREDFTFKELKKVYRSLVKKWHPDFNPSPLASTQFQKILKLKEILSTLFTE